MQGEALRRHHTAKRRVMRCRATGSRVRSGRGSCAGSPHSMSDRRRSGACLTGNRRSRSHGRRSAAFPFGARRSRRTRSRSANIIFQMKEAISLASPHSQPTSPALRDLQCGDALSRRRYTLVQTEALCVHGIRIFAPCLLLHPAHRPPEAVSGRTRMHSAETREENKKIRGG